MVTGVRIWGGTRKIGTRFGETTCVSAELAKPSQVQLSPLWVVLCLIRGEHFQKLSLSRDTDKVSLSSQYQFAGNL